MTCRHSREKGGSLVEFAFAGIPLLLIIVAIMKISLAMWSYHTLAYAVREGARFAATKGQGCTYTGNTCSVTVAAVAQQIAGAGLGLAPSVLNVTLTSSNGAISCNPLNSCYSNATVWPPASANTPGDLISVTGYYPSQTALTFLFLPYKRSMRTSAVTFAASSQQMIEF